MTKSRRKRLSLTLSQSEFDFVEEQAKAEGVSKSIYIRDLIRKEREAGVRERKSKKNCFLELQMLN